MQLLHTINGRNESQRLREDGKADFYDMNFLDEVKKGDWLGEKIPLTNSIPGKTITGEFAIAE